VSRSLGGSLPADILDRLSQAALGRHLGRVIPFVTVDAQGRPHPMLLSYLEVRAADPTTLRIVIGAGSRSARNLVERQAGTLLLIEPERTVYLKMRAIDGPLGVAHLAEAGLFVLRVEEVLEDAPADWEGGMRITAGIGYGPVPTLEEPWARATLEALSPPPRP
jgi:hypothetical protein